MSFFLLHWNSSGNSQVLPSDHVRFTRGQAWGLGYSDHLLMQIALFAGFVQCISPEWEFNNNFPTFSQICPVNSIKISFVFHLLAWALKTNYDCQWGLVPPIAAKRLQGRDKTHSLSRKPYCLGSLWAFCWRTPLLPSASPINYVKSRAVCQQKPKEASVIREAASCGWDTC